jgi:hypothetical protein
MYNLTDAEKVIVSTIACYSVMSELELNSIVDKATLHKHYNSFIIIGFFIQLVLEIVKQKDR